MTDSIDLSPRALRPLTAREIRLTVASVVLAEREFVRYVLVNMPVSRGLKACGDFIHHHSGRLTSSATYCLYRALGWVSGDDDGTTPTDKADQLCLM